MIDKTERRRKSEVSKFLWRLDRNVPQAKEYKLFRSKRRVAKPFEFEKEGMRINTFYQVPIDEIEHKVRVIGMPGNQQYVRTDKIREKQHQEKEELRQYIQENLRPQNALAAEYMLRDLQTKMTVEDVRQLKMAAQIFKEYHRINAAIDKTREKSLDVLKQLR